ncbi:MAG: hypothetical protein WBH20_08070 [Oceanisphaera sp.]|uniref:hypothetical protein n=1 Tax=Oceanisphaera sp. TaxID=1929979 RepID=UPI003C707709
MNPLQYLKTKPFFATESTEPTEKLRWDKSEKYQGILLVREKARDSAQLPVLKKTKGEGFLFKPSS